MFKEYFNLPVIDAVKAGTTCITVLSVLGLGGVLAMVLTLTACGSGGAEAALPASGDLVPPRLRWTAGHSGAAAPPAPCRRSAAPPAPWHHRAAEARPRPRRGSHSMT